MSFLAIAVLGGAGLAIAASFAGDAAASSRPEAMWIAQSTVEPRRSGEVGRLEARRAQLSRELARLEAADDRSEASVEPVVWDLADTLLQLELPAEAEPLVRRAIELRGRITHPESESVADALSLLSRVLAEQGEIGPAGPPLERAIELWLAADVAPAAPKMLDGMSRLAGLYSQAGRPQRAEPVLREAVTILERDAAEPVIIVDWMQRQAAALHAMDRGSEADDVLRRALAIAETAPGVGPRRTAVLWRARAAVSEDDSAAAEYYRKAMEALSTPNSDTASAGERAAALAETRMEFGRRLFRAGRRDDAAARMMQARDFYLDRREIPILREIADVSIAARQEAAAIPILEQIVAWDLERTGTASLERAADMERLALAVERAQTDGGSVSRLLDLRAEAYAIRAAVSGRDDYQTAVSAVALGRSMRVNGMPEEALEMIADTLPILRERHGGQDENTAVALLELGRSATVLGRVELAETHLRQAAALTENILGPDHSLLADALYALASLLQDTDRHSLAQPLKARADAIRARDREN